MELRMVLPWAPSAADAQTCSGSNVHHETDAIPRYPTQDESRALKGDVSV